MKKILIKFIIAIIIIVILVIVSVGIFYLYYQKSQQKIPVVVEPPVTEGVINSVVFNCAENKSIQAIFLKDRVELTLNDGRNMLLSQAVSASGARYANNNESFVFWNKGDTAFIDEAGQITFKDCLIK